MANLEGAAFTRSLYIGRDKTAEVLKRKEAVEKELQAKREAKVREQNERLARAAQQKEAELRDRARARQQRELEKQKAVLDRRCAQLEQMNAKKTEILQRTHQNASRIEALNQKKKPAYVFGSSTPRKLTYLEKLDQQQRERPDAQRNSRGSSPALLQPHSSNTAPTTARVPSRFLVPAAAKHSQMTRSVHGSLGDPSVKQPKQQQPAKRTPMEVKRQRERQANGGMSSAMTQSLYLQKTSGDQRVAKSPISAARPSPNLAARPVTPTNSKKTSPQQSKVALADQKPKPVIRPRKALQQQQIAEAAEPIGISATVPAQVIQEEVVVAANNLGTAENAGISSAHGIPANDQIVQMAEPNLVVKTEVPEEDAAPFDDFDRTLTLAMELSQVQPADETERTLTLEEELMNADVGHQQRDQKDGDLLVPKVETDSVEKDNKVGVEADSVDSRPTARLTNTVTQETTPVDINKRDIFDEPPTENGDATAVTSPPPPVKSPISPLPAAAIVLSDEREERRKRLNEILQRTRQEPAVNGNNGGGNGKSTLSNSTVAGGKTTVAATNPLIPQVDASALAQELLAQRRLQKLQQQGREKDEPQKEERRPGALANELAGSGFFAENSQFYQLPGQVVTPQQEEQILPAAHQQQPFRQMFDHFTPSLDEGEGDLISHSLLKRQHPTPPEDPQTNGHKQLNGRDEHPPEPTSDIINFDD